MLQIPTKKQNTGFLKGVKQQPVPDNINVTSVVVTPEIAKKWLETQYVNRNIRPSHVLAMARDINAGHFEFTAAPIVFDYEGHLIDGQHRLNAVIEADRAVQFLVVYGFSADIQKYIDHNRPRKAADQIAMAGQKYAAQQAAAMQAIIALVTGRNRTHFRPSEVEKMEWVEMHPNILESCKAVYASKLPPGVTSSYLIATHYIGAYLLGKNELADRYVEVMQTGIPSYAGDPAQRFRERLVRQTPNSRISPDNIRIGFAHSWNLFSDESSVTHFRFPESAKIKGVSITDIAPDITKELFRQANPSTMIGGMKKGETA